MVAVDVKFIKMSVPFNEPSTLFGLVIDSLDMVGDSDAIIVGAIVDVDAAKVVPTRLINTVRSMDKICDNIVQAIHIRFRSLFE